MASTIATNGALRNRLQPGPAVSFPGRLQRSSRKAGVCPLRGLTTPRTSRTRDRGPERRAEAAVFGRLFLQRSTSTASWRRTGSPRQPTGNLPAIVVMCTNRLEALDPPVRRRAAVTFTFSRPNEVQRAAFLKPVLEDLGFSPQQIHSLVTATGATQGRPYGYTYSDLAQRLLPGLLLAAYPSNPITFEMAKEVVEHHPPTPPFRESLNGIS